MCAFDRNKKGMKFFMKITGEQGIGKVLKIFLQVCLYSGIIILIGLPFVLSKIGFNLGSSMYVIYPNGIVLLLITYKFIKMFDSLRLNNPFCDENVKLLKVTGIISLIGSIFWLIDFMCEIFLVHSEDIVFNCTLIFLCILFLGVSIALYILSELLKQATEFKKENDLTI